MRSLSASVLSGSTDPVFGMQTALHLWSLHVALRGYLAYLIADMFVYLQVMDHPLHFCFQRFQAPSKSFVPYLEEPLDDAV